MPSNMAMVLCEYCGWKNICPVGEYGLYQPHNDTLSSEKVRCPGCGRSITPRKMSDPQAEIEQKNKEDRMKSENEAWMEKAIEYQIEFLKGKDGQNFD